mgnify:CR=1 FL=1|jgi:hypothetical protein
MRACFALITVLLLLPVAAHAEAVRAACLVSERQAAAPRLCKCIQVAADATLDRQEQDLAASFFSDPHRAQVIRQSKDQSHGLFWERYKDFSALAEAFCKS